MITLKKAFRTDENTVHVMYYHNETKHDFVIEWSNIHPSTGDIADYDLQLECLSPSEHLNHIVVEAIQEGESDDNDNIELYLEIRDTFTSLECEDLE